MLTLAFFPPNSPDQALLVEITFPSPKGEDWVSTVKFSGAFSKSVDVVQVDGVQVLYDCFHFVRREIVGFDPSYKHNGMWDIEGVFPETFPRDYGSNTYAQVKAFSDRLVAEEEEKRTVKTLAWMRSNPDWVKKNRHLLSEEMLNRLAGEDD